jgi:hypothetical protein
MLEERIDQDLKKAMLARDSVRVSTLRGIKSVVLYAKVAAGDRSKPLPDEVMFGLLAKESQKRRESADLYEKANETARAEAELSEKAIIDEYLPSQLSDEELQKIIEEELQKQDNPQMGPIISAVKSRTSGQADGARIANLVKEMLKK